jgi:F5/8 type C domain-containing protein
MVLGAPLLLAQPIGGPDTRLDVPDRSAWQARASTNQTDMHPPHLAIDGDPGTRWSSSFEDGQWIEFDLGKSAAVTGVILNWESAYASKYRVQCSDDGESWRTLRSIEDGDGHVDQLYFKPTTARLWRIACDERATGWGASLWEVELLGTGLRPIITANPSAQTPSTEPLMDGDSRTAWQGSGDTDETIEIDLRRGFNLTGLHIEWGESYAADAVLEVSDDGEHWQTHAEMTGGIGRYDVVVGQERMARHLRLTLGELSDPSRPIEIKELSLRGVGEAISATMLYQSAAKKWPAGYYPEQARRRQSYWTVVGLPRDTEETLLDEYGSVEARAGRPMVMPYLVTDQGEMITAADATELTQTLVDGWLPLPTVVWELEGLTLTIEVVPAGQPGASATFVRYRLTNTSDTSQQGELFLAIRPHQVNPAWQHGGVAGVHAIDYAEISGQTHAVKVNGEPVYIAMDKPTGFGATGFRNGDIIGFIAKGSLPAETLAEDDEGLASAAMSFDYALKPGKSRDVALAIPLHGNADDVAQILNGGRTGTGASDVSASFDRLKTERAAAWRDKLNKVDVSVGDREVTDTLRAQAGYILINQDGDAIQPGSRNYNRSWIRDGSITATALMRMGLQDEALRYIRWYADRVPDSGLVPPILNTDGTGYHGWGADIEYDAQGQFVYLVMEYYRLTGDKAFLREHLDKLTAVMRTTAELCERTRQPGHMPDTPARERFAGILPPSISHEGYSDPMHSYWDDYWALKGWHDLAEAAEILGEPELKWWADTEYQKFAGAVRSTIDATVAFKQIDYLPSSADLGDPDPTSISIGIYPCKQLDVMRPDLLTNTYDQYFASVVERAKPGVKFGYTPYEIRNVTSFALLGQPERAQVLFDFLMLGRRPAGWRHLAEVVHSNERLGSYIGDMPHTWVGSGYVHAVLSMIFVNQDDQLRLFVATPKHWLENDGVTLRDVPTHFGKLNLKAKLTGETLHVNIGEGLTGLSGIRIEWPWDPRPTRVEVDGQPTDPDAPGDDSGITVAPTAREVTVRW